MNLTDPSKKDIIRVIGELERKDLSAWTKHDYKVAIKRFFRWYNDGIGSDYTNWFKLTKHLNNLPEVLIAANSG
ncbi:hypothetical protein HNV12_15965 [Methanococcoides sp. SA1]|nr:hypothetical protein [Methanococcoides sp. SA1]